MIYLGVDWAEAHHDACLLDESGRILARVRVPDGIAGVAQLHAMVSDHASEPREVAVGIELDRGLLVGALASADYRVFAINPLSVDRYRDRHATSGAKSDASDAKLLADIVRTDRHNLRELAADSDLADAVKVLCRAHKDMIWGRQRLVSRIRNLLREFYPGALEAFGTNLSDRDALAVLAAAPTPAQGRRLSEARIAQALRRGGRRRHLTTRAAEIAQALAKPQLEAPEILAKAYAASVRTQIGVLEQTVAAVEELERELSSTFRSHPDAEIYLSQPGLGDVLGARALGEFGDDPNRYANPKSRKAYAGTAPITKASGTKRVVLARFARNDRIADTCQLWAFSALTRSPGARRYYDELRARGKTHNHALRQLANRLVGILHTCLNRHELYREDIAWHHHNQAAA